MSFRNVFTKVIIFCLLILAVILTIIPIVWMISTSLKSATGVFTFPIKWLPDGFHWENYQKALQARPFFVYLLNSILASSVSVIITVVISIAAGYGFAHFNFPGREGIFILVLSTIMIPFEIIALPLYLQVYSWGWFDTYAGLILPTALAPIGVFIMRQYMLSIPRSLIESARLDGASEFQILQKIISPLVMPAISSVAIFTFVSTWNSYLWPLLILSKDKMRTLPLGMAMFENQLTTTYNQVMAVAFFGMVPMILMFAIFQKFFIEGVVLTGLKE